MSNPDFEANTGISKILYANCKTYTYKYSLFTYDIHVNCPDNVKESLLRAKLGNKSKLSNALKFYGMYQIYYGDNQIPSLDPQFTPYFNKTLTPYFETQVYYDMIKQNKHVGYTYFGVLSHSFGKKVMKWNKLMEPYTINMDQIDDLYNKGMDIISFGTHQPNTIYSTHHSLYATLTMLLNAIGKSQTLVNKIIKNPIYCNYFIAKPHIWDMYIAEYIEPSMNIINNDPEMHKLLWEDSGYSGSLTKDELRQKIGVDYYPRIPFVFERLINFFIEGHPEIKVANATPRKINIRRSNK